MEVIKWDAETLKILPCVFKILQSVLNKDTGAAYLVYDDDRLNIFAHNGNHAVYIDNKDKTLNVSSYILDENYNIKKFAINGKQYYFLGESLNAYNTKTGYEEALLLNDESDDDEPDGLVKYTQYDKKRDIECEIQYEHRYFKSASEARGRIYPYRLENISSLMIDINNGSNHAGVGLLSKKHIYFTQLNAPNDSLDYSIAAIKEGGLLEYLKNGAKSIIGSDTAIRYVKGIYVGRDRVFRTLWPLGKTHKEEDILKIVRDLGFDPEIPKDLMEIYNDENDFINKIKELLKQVKEIDKVKDEEKCLIYSITP